MNQGKKLLLAGTAFLTLCLGSACVTQSMARKPNLEKKIEETRDNLNYKTFLTRHNLIRLTILGMPYENIVEFKDTKKHNAVFIYPLADVNKAFQNKDAHSFLEKIRKDYDVWACVADKEEHVYEALNKIPNKESIDFLVLGGHGTQKTLRLGYGSLNSTHLGLREFMFINWWDKEYMIDMFDKDIVELLAKKLAPNAVIFLTSCSSGKGGEEEDNLANFLGDELEKIGRDDIKINSSKEDFAYREVFMKTTYPFDNYIIKFNYHFLPDKPLLFLLSCRDCTYTNKSSFKKPSAPKNIKPQTNYKQARYGNTTKYYHRKILKNRK